MDGSGINGLNAKVKGGSAALAEGDRWARLNSGDIQAGGVRGRSHSVGRCDISRKIRGQLQELELPTIFNVEKERNEHFKWTHLEQVQHCTDLPNHVTFLAHIEQGKTGPRLR